jgi:hypothetical protein
MRHRLSLALILASALAAPSAAAQPKPDAPKPEAPKPEAPKPDKPDAAKPDAKPPKSDALKAEEARLAKLAEARLAELVKRGTEACDRGEIEDGLAALSAAWTQKNDGDVAAALASCEIKAKQWGGAADHLMAALRTKEEGAERKRLEEMLAEAQKHAGTIQITVSVEGADVFVGNRFVGQSPLAAEVWADAGKPVLIIAKKTGYDEAQRTVDVVAHRSVAVKLDLAIETAGPNRYASASRSKVPFFLLGGLGLVAGGVGAALYAAAATKASAAEDILAERGGDYPCKNTKATGCPTVLSLRQGHDKLANIGTGLLVGGGVLIGAAALTGVWAFGTGSSSSSSRGPSRGVALAPAVSPDGAGLWLSGSF